MFQFVLIAVGILLHYTSSNFEVIQLWDQDMYYSTIEGTCQTDSQQSINCSIRNYLIIHSITGITEAKRINLTNYFQLLQSNHRLVRYLTYQKIVL